MVLQCPGSPAQNAATTARDSWPSAPTELQVISGLGVAHAPFLRQAARPKADAPWVLLNATCDATSVIPVARQNFRQWARRRGYFPAASSHSSIVLRRQLRILTNSAATMSLAEPPARCEGDIYHHGELTAKNIEAQTRNISRNDVTWFEFLRRQ